jgi:hypothetical protein
MFQPNERVTVELLFSFKGIKRVEVPEERIHRS